MRDVQYVGPVTRFYLTLDRGGELQVLDQNLEEGSLEVLELKGRPPRRWQGPIRVGHRRTRGRNRMRRKRIAVWAALGLLVAALSVVAAGCGGGTTTVARAPISRARLVVRGDPGIGPCDEARSTSSSGRSTRS